MTTFGVLVRPLRAPGLAPAARLRCERSFAWSGGGSSLGIFQSCSEALED
eukprot:CAMPEP_0202389110 /NCGR_PEP_ID=MMETSP1127-20130417/81167_1 /ASSEMBLY_ACC=CAM_ASM_000462 /TAXON_ID=3047 /ORGANISM="Dunaliella tertiolecta, Strain CCMP1320" /LENGTH=49 /DNA_ID= /DNA_START= /DNA_END= /DNA_ORIENTATION=